MSTIVFTPEWWYSRGSPCFAPAWLPVDGSGPVNRGGLETVCRCDGALAAGRDWPGELCIFSQRRAVTR